MALKNAFFAVREKRNAAFTVRITESTLKMIKFLSRKHNCSQSEIIESLVKSEWERSTNKSKPTNDLAESDSNLGI